MFMIFIVAGIISTIVGLTVFFQDSKSASNRFFMVGASIISMSFITTGLVRIDHSLGEADMLVQFNILATSFIPLALYILSRGFLCGQLAGSGKKSKWMSSIIACSSVIVVGLLMTIVGNMIVAIYGSELYINRTVTINSPMSTYIIIQELLIGLSVIAIGAYSLDRLAKSRKKFEFKSTKIAMSMLIVLSLAFQLSSSLAMPFVKGDYSFVLMAGVLAVLGLVLVYGVGYWVFGFYDSRPAILQTVSIGGSLTIISSFYLLLGSVETFDRFNLAVSGLLVGISAVAFGPIANLLHKILKKIFDPTRKIDNFIAHLNTRLAQTPELEPLLTKLSYDLADALESKNVQFYIKYGANNNKKMLVASDKKSKIPASDIEFMAEVGAKAEDVIITRQSFLGKDSQKMLRLMKSHGWHLVVPLKNSERIIGFVLVGEPKKSRFRSVDVNILRRVYNNLMIALNSAIAIYAVKDINSTLEQRISNATQDLRRANQHLQSIDTSKDDFLSMASHQLRTPLTSIKGYISMVIDGDAGEINEQQQKFLTEAFLSSDRMVRVVNDFLNVSRLQTGKFVLDKTKENLAEMVCHEADILRQTAKTRDLKLKLSIDKNTPSIEADHGKLRQVVMNMIDNAIYYSPANTTIEVSLKNKKDRVEFTVKDQGIGVPKEEQAELFTKFYRAANARKQRPDGTGVGLYLAKKIINTHNGGIIFSSKEKQGSTFGFWLPKK